MADDETIEGKKKLSKLEKLQERKKKIKQQDARVQTQINQIYRKEKKQEEKDRTHMLCEVGGSMLAEMRENPESKKFINDILNRRVSSEKARLLLALPPLPENTIDKK